MHFSKSSTVVIGASALVFVASLALAQDAAPFPECTKAPAEADVEAAKQSHIIATSRFNLQDWDKAVEFWRQAYGLDCTAHALLVNIANAYEKKGDKRNAVMALETYLVRAKDAPDLVKVNERVIDLKKSMEPAPPVTATATATATATVTAAPTATPPPTGPRPFGNTPLFVAGAGGVLALAGAILVPVGLGPYGDAQAKCPGPDCTLAVAASGNAGKATWNAGAAFLGIGAAAAAGGLVWHFVFNQPKPAAPAAPGASPPPVKARVEVIPVTGPQLSGLVVNGRF